ncbi:MAG: class I SAM-dependent methyltransferase [Myxococcota bacterium]
MLRSTANPPHDPAFVRTLFDEMAETYGLVNLVCSFGFALRWRRQCIASLPRPDPAERFVDLMSGMGELWRSIFDRFGDSLHVSGIELSPEMARRSDSKFRGSVEVRIGDVFDWNPSNAPADAVVCSFGLKTFDAVQQLALARRVAEALRDGGTYSFVEISVPRIAFLRVVYLFYLDRVIPFIGWLMLGNPANYRMLGRYTRAFGDCRHFARCLAEAGLEVQYRTYFFGCATGVLGRKPSVPLVPAE